MVASITGTDTYDANGNLTAGAGRSVAYTAFKMAATITQGTTVASFAYDVDHARMKMAVGSSTTYYAADLGGMAERIVAGASSTWHDYLNVDGKIVAMRTSGTPGTSWRYFVSDHLGSAASVTDGSGAVVERDAYDPWGKRRNLNGSDDTTCSLASLTTRGYTGHEHIDAQCLINMNARVYDPTIARFMTPDTYVADANNLQDWNAYTYVNNRPLTLTDPIGHTPANIPLPTWEQDEFDATNPTNPTPKDWSNFAQMMALAATLNAIEPGLGLPEQGVANVARLEARLDSAALSATARAQEIHRAPDPIAQVHRTTAVLETSEGRIIAGGARDLTPAQRTMLRPGESAARLPGAHAEQTVLQHAAATGARPQALGTARPVCADCGSKIEATGGKITGPNTAIWPQTPPTRPPRPEPPVPTPKPL